MKGSLRQIFLTQPQMDQLERDLRITIEWSPQRIAPSDGSQARAVGCRVEEGKRQRITVLAELYRKPGFELPFLTLQSRENARGGE